MGEKMKYNLLSMLGSVSAAQNSCQESISPWVPRPMIDFEMRNHWFGNMHGKFVDVPGG
jgi:hypothetical protein